MRWCASRSSPGKLFPFLKAMEFFAIIKRLGGAARRRSRRLRGRSRARRQARRRRSASTTPPAPKPAPRGSRPSGRADAAAGAPCRRRCTQQIKAHPARSRRTYEIIRRRRRTSQRWIDAIYADGLVATDTETTGLDNQTADLVGISLRHRARHRRLPAARPHRRAQATSSAAARPKARWTCAQALDAAEARVRRSARSSRSSTTSNTTSASSPATASRVDRYRRHAAAELFARWRRSSTP